MDYSPCHLLLVERRRKRTGEWWGEGSGRQSQGSQPCTENSPTVIPDRVDVSPSRDPGTIAKRSPKDTQCATSAGSTGSPGLTAALRLPIDRDFASLVLVKPGDDIGRNWTNPQPHRITPPSVAGQATRPALRQPVNGRPHGRAGGNHPKRVSRRKLGGACGKHRLQRTSRRRHGGACGKPEPACET
jgi:hypothetical protein